MKKIFPLLLILGRVVALGQDEIIIDGQPCNMHGSARSGSTEFRQNVFKDRYNFPRSSDFATNLTLNDFVHATATDGKFSQAKAAQLIGYVFDVKIGGTETCNCKTTDPLFKDTHIELTMSDQETGKDKRVIVEVTPRIRQTLADSGIDWTTEALKGLKGHMVKIQGWQFYDSSHLTENFADDPGDNIGKPNWRATSWEIHPITNLEVLDEPIAAAGMEPPEETNITAPVAVPETPGTTSQTKTTQTMTPINTLAIIIMGAILGMVGQGIRVVVGLKKLGDVSAQTGIDEKALFQTRQLVLSLFIAFAIGAIAGVLAAVGSVDISFSKSMIVAFIAAGYAGTDFIEGFIRKNPVIIKSDSAPPATGTTTTVTTTVNPPEG